MKTCAICHIEPRLPYHCYCQKCRQEYRDSKRTKPKKFARRPNRTDGLCPECGLRPKQEYHGYCRKCANNKHKEWIKKQGGQWAYYTRRGSRHKLVARAYVNHLRQRGKIQKKPCEVCGKLETEAHHNSYENALDIRWLCEEHHDALEAWKRMKSRKGVDNTTT